MPKAGQATIDFYKIRVRDIPDLTEQERERLAAICVAYWESHQCYGPENVEGLARHLRNLRGREPKCDS